MKILQIFVASTSILLLSSCAISTVDVEEIDSNYAMRGRDCVPQTIAQCHGLSFMGLGTYTKFGLADSKEQLISGFTPSAQGIDQISGNRFFWRIEDYFISVEDDSIRSRELVIAAAQALAKIEKVAPEIFREIVQSKTFPNEKLLSQWRNRNAVFVISFDKSPDFVAAQTTLIDTNCISLGNVCYYGNTAIISIDTETIQGNTPGRGSRKIYGREVPRENYELYLGDGLVYSIAHEFLHTNIDRLNSTSKFAQKVHADRVNIIGVNAEEAVIVATTLHYLGNGISTEMIVDATKVLNEFLEHAETRNAIQRLCSLAEVDTTPAIRYTCPLP